MRTTMLVALTLLLGCAIQPMQSEGVIGGVTLDVEPWTARAGQSVLLTLRNSTDETVGFNLCTSTLEREEAGGWETIPSDRACTMELRTLEPGGEATYEMALERDLEPGDYRYRTRVHLMDAETTRDVVSDAFAVQG